MDAFKIEGGHALSGTVDILGAKNAVLPIMAGALLTKEDVFLDNVSFLSDVKTLIALLESMGMYVQQHPESNRLILNARDISSTHAGYEFVSKMRASFWVLGPLLARFHKAEVSLPGGCAIGTRPVDLYLKALEAMGAQISVENGYVKAQGPLHGAEIFFPKVSVGATHNTIMAAVLTPGETIIHNPALEPEVMDLIAFLKKMGADITGVGTKTLLIRGVERLRGTQHKIVSDRIEAATFAVGATLLKSKIFLKGARLDLMQAVGEALKNSQVVFNQESDGLWVDATNAHITATPITTAEHPGFPTDAQALFTTLLTLAHGESVIEERIFENRFMHVPELVRMGANIKTLNNNSILITGTDHLSGTTVMSSDLRGGVALVLAGLVAQGETIVQRIYHIDRGYYHIEDKLTALGAHIERIKIPM